MHLRLDLDKCNLSATKSDSELAVTKKIKTNEFAKCFFLRYSKYNSLMIKSESSSGRIVKKKKGTKEI